ncbi:uncharacterized protein FSUBG_4676 [Fusarium subglutinans]|uniref:HNH nuclease domain-containing protein n=1 Tax=Gibberella subglutinans TaxID=42677 RepID=A0A8H5Q5C2_GIBSU|nr:uncharacterized protein FSUBG_4676 [Fusarium subglutinans]KAF5608458.1 hypothetical protein FSUBG_4676 [Fusarium subglutinans]
MVKATQQPDVCDFQPARDFTEPDPLVSSFESRKRLEYTKQLEASIQSDYAYLLPGFGLDLYHVATILTIPSRNFKPPLRLSMESCLIDGRPFGGNNHQDILEKLEDIPPFYRHYMMNLGAADVAPELQPYALRDNEPQPTYSDVDSDDMDVDFKKLLRRYARTIPTLEDHLRDEAEAAKCRARDGNICIVTGKPNPKTYHILPFTCNDTVNHNNNTAYVRAGAESLLLKDIPAQAPYVSNSRTLGGSDKAWNQLCLDPELYSWWAKGYCAFKFMHSHDISAGKEMVTLQFRWMPQIKKRPRMTMKIHGTGPENDWLNLMAELDTFHAQHQPPPKIGGKTLRATTKAGTPLQSGHLIHICLPKEDVERLEVVINLQWCSIVFMAFIGAAGTPEMPLRDKLEEKVMTWLEDESGASDQDEIDRD